MKTRIMAVQETCVNCDNANTTDLLTLIKKCPSNVKFYIKLKALRMAEEETAQLIGLILLWFLPLEKKNLNVAL